MADVIRDFDGYPRRLKDMGDGTFAEVVSTSSGGGGSGSSDINVSEVGGNLVADAIPTKAIGNGVTPVNRSGAIVTGGTAQQLMAANATRKGFWVQNLSSTEEMWINDSGAATQSEPSLLIPPEGYYAPEPTGVPTGAVSIVAATAAHPFSAREW